MTTSPVQLSLCFFLPLLVSFIGNTLCDLDDQYFETNRRERLNVPYNSYEERLARFDDQFVQPVENVRWQGPGNIGQISGVAVNPSGKPVIFHRGHHTWNYDTFDENNNYRRLDLGPIMENTVLTLSPITGMVQHGFGNETFFLPHGIHIDSFGNIWLTDIVMQQVFKYNPSGSLRLVLGNKFQHGSDLEHFCQPTSVATAFTGEIVVADGYCNSRLVVFDPEGTPKYSIDEPLINLSIPHSVTILPNEDVCVADREHERIVCMNIGLRGTRMKPNRPYSIRHRQLGRVFAITSYGGIIYGVNGTSTQKHYSKGFTASPITDSVINFWGPESDIFVRPHAIAVCPNGSALYVSEIGPNRIWKFDLLATGMRI